MSDLQLVVFGVALAIVVMLGFVASVYNQLQRLVNLIPEASSNIQVLLKKRHELITRLTAIVDSYGLHEKFIMGKVSSDFGRGKDKAGASNVISRLSSLQMHFPQLKADALFGELMAQLVSVETEALEKRELFNSTVRAYNTYLSQFPNNLVGPIFGFRANSYLNNQDLDFLSEKNN